MIALLARVSTQEQAVEGYSIGEQLERMKDYCSAMGWKNYKTYVDAGFSGSNMNRPALQELISDVKKGLVEKVIVYKLDRLSRSQKDTLHLIEDIFLANHTEFISITENFDTSSPFGRAMIGILAVFAQLEREQIKERMSMGREGRAKEGKWKGGGPVPFGYSYKNGLLVINPYEAMQIRELYDLFLLGHSLKSIERTFRAKGYKRRGKDWTKTAVTNTVKNRLYAGYIEYKGTYYKGEHEPIISSETFEKAAALLRSYESDFKNNKRAFGDAGKALLSGLLYCGHCGAKYTTSQQTSRGKVFRYYSCYSRNKRNLAMVIDPNCKNKNWRMEKLDEIILVEIGKLSADPSAITGTSAPDQTDGKTEKAQILSAEIEKTDRQRSRLIDLYSLGDFTAEELQAKIKPLQETKNRLQAELEALQQETRLSTAEASQIVSSFSDVIARGQKNEIRLLVNSLIEKIELNGEDIRIYWKFS